MNRVANVHPAFRQSLRDMEKHVGAQGASSSMWPVQWHGFVKMRVPVPEYAPESGKMPAPAGQQASVQVLEFRESSAEQRSWHNVEGEPQMPWWMPHPARTQSRPDPKCATSPRFSENESPAPIRIQTPKLPDWFWKGEPAGPGDSPAQSSAQPRTESGVIISDSRIERLRGLFADVGLADLHRSHAPLSETVQEIPDQNEEIPDQNEAPALSEQGAAESSITAPAEPKSAPEPAPELVALPREFVPVKEPVQDNDIRILPAKRGQYGSR